MKEYGLQALAILGPVLLAAVAWLSLRIANLISARVRTEYLRNVLIRLNDTAFAVVREVFQTYVDALKTGGGKLTAEQAERAKEKAVEALRSHLGLHGLADLTKVLGLSGEPLERFLGTKVEAAVHLIKSEESGTPVPIGSTIPFVR